MRLRHWSLRYKFLGLIGLILVVATTSYLGLAVRLFNDDKTAYVFETNAALANALGEEAATGFTSSLKTMRLAALAVDAGEDAVRALMRDDDEIAALRVQRVDAQGVATTAVELTDATWLERGGLDAKGATALLDETAVPVKLLAKTGMRFQNAARGEGSPLLAAALAVKVKDGEGDDAEMPRFVVSALLKQDRRILALQRSTADTAYLIDEAGELLAHADATKLRGATSLAATPVVKKVLAATTPLGVYSETAQNGEAVFVAYKKLPTFGLAVVVEVPRAKALFASRKLIEKSGQLAVLVLALSFLVSIGFSRRLTSALHRLYDGTLKVAKGDFGVEVEVRTEDEVGALSKSFNRMAGEISRLLVETADKARMEKELETAQLVQDNFFPKEELRVHDFEVAAYFKPASECGGDWWGGLTLGDQLILLIGDATGHGVPAALITAAAHSCAMTLARLAERVAGFPLSPSFLMDSLNAAIYHAGRGRVKMTFFAAVIDCRTGKVRYANASHEPPLICRGKEDGGEPTKEDLDTLASKPDPCLGESLATIYHEHEGQLNARDAMVLFTDGITECRNTAKEEYGERRLMRSLVKAATAPAAGLLKDQLIAGANTFAAGGPQEDDVTLVVVKRQAAASNVKAAG